MPPAILPPTRGEHKHRAILFGSAIVVLAVLIGFGVAVFPRSLDRRSFEESYALISDKVSQSASIVIRLPKGVAVAEAATAITFEPEISGTWLKSGVADQLIFQPKEKLPLGKYFTATLTASDTKLSKDFLIDEDPKITAIFPASSTPASEFSEITIVFNRPMVPLTVLDAFTPDAAQLVSVTPATPGKFKWTSTRNLQFIPETRLMRSAQYRVEVKPGFKSVEGLAVPSGQFAFTTRPLRYEQITSGPLSYSQPMRVVFNQPVDLEKTKAFIKVTEARGQAVSFSVRYGTRMVRDPKNGKERKVTDRGLVEIYNAQDRFGRKDLWDFNTNYTLTVSEAVPVEGDIPLKEQRQSVYQVGELITSFEAESPSSTLVSPELFDPRGTIIVEFPETIEIQRSSIQVKNLKNITYGESCKEDEYGNIVWQQGGCEKEEDKKKLVLHFNPTGFQVGETAPIQFERVVNREGLQLNPEKIVKNITVYPALRILKTVPANGGTNAKPESVTLCTNSPLRPATEDNFNAQFKTNLPIGLWEWYQPYQVQREQFGTPCSVGEFVNTIRVGLAPERDIEVSLNVVDDFGQKAQTQINFRTGKVPELSRNFHHSQSVYNVTSPDKTKLTYSVENFDYLNLNICKVSPENMLRYLDKRSDVLMAPSSFDCEETINRTVDLPDRYWTRNYFQINLADYVQNPLGQYIVTFSHPDHRRVDQIWDQAQRKYVREESLPVYERTYVSVTRLAVQEKQVKWQESDSDPNKATVSGVLLKNPQSLYWVSEFKTLRPVIAATVQIYDKDLALLASGTTDSQGVALLRVVPNARAAIIRSGGDAAIISEAVDSLQYAYPAHSATKMYLYTDRPIYRPGQKVFIKGLYRLGYDGDYETATGKVIKLAIRDSRNNVVMEKDVTLNEYGTFTTELVLDSGAPLGSYYMSAGNGYASFDVEEYVPSAFQVNLKADKEEYIAQDAMNLDVQADYFFGVPLDGGEVEYSLTSQDYYFDKYKGEGYFNFGGNYYYDGWRDTFITRGKTTVGSNGKATISQKLNFAELFKGEDGKRSKIFVMHVTVKNKNGQSVSAQKSFIVHRGDLYLGVRMDRIFAGKGEDLTARFKTVDIKGNPQAISGITVEVRKVSWISSRRQEVDGRYYYKSEQKKEVVKKDTVGTDRDGNTLHTVHVDKEGEYELALIKKDSRGNEITVEQYFYVYGTGTVQVRPTNNATLELVTDKSKVDVGEKTSFVIKSPFQVAKALITIERGQIFDYRIIDVNGGLGQYQFDVRSPYVPNIYASVLLLSNGPEIKYGQIEYQVNTKDVALSINVKSDKKEYLPGEKVNLTIETKDVGGKGVPAELSLAVVDMSVLALKGNIKKNPLVFFYDGFPLSVVTASNVKNVLFEAEIPAGTKGGGGESPEELAKKKRGEFRETALWDGTVRTNEAGVATLSFTLPDNLTSWQIESVGITKDTKVGVDYKEFTARKEVMAVPLAPRFIVPGDTFSLGGNIFNQTSETQTFSVTLDSPALEKKDSGTKSITLKPGTSETVYFKVQAPERVEKGNHLFTLSAKNNLYEDVVEMRIPITRNNTFEAVATAGYTTNAITKEYVFLPDVVVPNRGGLEVNMNATLANFVSDALSYLFTYPYGCSEQLASKLSAIAIVERGLNIKNVGETWKIGKVTLDGVEYTVDEAVKRGLARIYENQTYSGGFSYYKNLQPEYYLTMHVLNALLDLKEAGYEVEDRVINNAALYMNREISSRREYLNDRDLIILSAYTLSRIPNAAESAVITTKMQGILNDQAYLQEKISNISLSHIALYLHQKGYSETTKNSIFQILDGRIDIDSRGAHVKQGTSNRLFAYYQTPIKDTALFLKASAATRRDGPILDKTVRWLLRSRDKDGAWASTNNTLAVVDAFSELLSWKRETESEFDVSLLFDDKELDNFSFGSKNIFGTLNHFIPTEEISQNQLHTISLKKDNKNNLPNGLYYDLSLKYFLPVDALPPRDEGFSIARSFYDAKDGNLEHPLKEAKPGEVLRGRLTITVPEARNFVTIEDFIPAGMELVNLKLAIEDQSLRKLDNQEYPSEFFGSRSSLSIASVSDAIGWVKGLWGQAGDATLGIGDTSPDDVLLYGTGRQTRMFYPDHEESHDDRLLLFKQRLQPGVYEYDYFVRALIPGSYGHLPATVSELYFPENFGRTAGDSFEVKE